jgi:hypothetical protein
MPISTRRPTGAKVVESCWGSVALSTIERQRVRSTEHASAVPGLAPWRRRDGPEKLGA